MSVAGSNSKNNINSNIILTIKDTKLYVPVVTLSARNNQKLSKLLSKGFKRSVYWNDYKTQSQKKNTANEYKYFRQSSFIGFIRLL